MIEKYLRAKRLHGAAEAAVAALPAKGKDGHDADAVKAATQARDSHARVMTKHLEPIAEALVDAEQWNKDAAKRAKAAAKRSAA